MSNEQTIRQQALKEVQATLADVLEQSAEDLRGLAARITDAGIDAAASGVPMAEEVMVDQLKALAAIQGIRASAAAWKIAGRILTMFLRSVGNLILTL